jgi:arylsulfatase A-like enzyme
VSEQGHPDLAPAPAAGLRGDIVRTAWVLAAATLAPLVLEIAVGVARAARHGVVAAALFVAMGLALAVLCAALAGLLALVIAPAVRLWLRAARGGEPAAGAALFTGRAPAAGAAALVHAVAIAATLFVAGTAAVATSFVGRFHDDGLRGLVTAVAGLVVLAVAATIGAGVFSVLRRRPPRARAARHPLGDPRGAILAWLLVGWLAAGVAVASWHAFALVFPGRLAAALSFGAIILLEGGAVARRVVDDRGRTRRAARIAAAIAVAVAAVALFTLSDSRARGALLEGPPLRAGYQLLGALTDVDRDGYSSILGGGDCAPLDGAINPAARDVRDDGVDQNCSGADARSRVHRTAPDVPLPPALRRTDYNLLLVSIDTMRYDRTSPAGYARDTTPSLAGLAARGAWCEQAHAAGTLTRDSLPVLAAGQHLAELPLGAKIPNATYTPRVLLPGAITLAEVLAARGYRTAMFTAFWYFGQWQIDQGMERMVNLPNGNVHGISPRIVQAAIDHLAALPAQERWFAWVHLLDPHAPYQRHAGFPSFGAAAADLYDADVAYADHHLGLLLRWVEADPARAARTVIVVTADHGEHLGEGGLQYHGNTLDDALTRVPLVVYVPGMQPRRVTTPISLVDLAPTMAAILGVPPSPEWTGASQLAAIFDGHEDPDRILFAASSARDEYVAITPAYRLHLDAANDLWRLVDLARDPLERDDASEEQPEARARLERALVTWREEIAASE